MTLMPKLLAPVTLIAFAAITAPARAQDPNEVFAVYDRYEAGYDETYEDDWFFDRYQFAPGAFDPYYDYYSSFDYKGDAFTWEEGELFQPQNPAPAASEAPPSEGPAISPSEGPAIGEEE